MIYQKLLYIIALCSTLCIQTDPVLVAVLMVKNEEAVMELTLQPLVDAGIKDFLIYDTGSSDNTIQITQDFFIKNQIPNFVIEQGEFIDFATSRNRALELTELYFPDATFMLMLDAEWILHNGTDLLKFCEQEKNALELVYAIQVQGLNIDFSHARLFRCKKNIKFIGKVHEFPSVVFQKKVSDLLYFELSSTHYQNQKSTARWLRDCDLLLQQLKQDPKNARIAYYLAQTYFCLKDWENAAKWYEYRVAMSGDDEENFLAMFALAATYQILNNKEQAITTYLKAFCIRPHRAEPLIRLAEYYYSLQSYHLCYLFARHACTMAYPYQDASPIEKWSYDFIRYNLLSATASIFGDFALGKQATLKALQSCPNEQYLHDNLKYYETMLKKF
jgi:tetratricopeptide (TPR) repeat protein